MTEQELKPPKPLGKVIEPYGEIVGIHSQGGERSYFFNNNGVVTLMPAELIEPVER